MGLLETDALVEAILKSSNPVSAVNNMTKAINSPLLKNVMKNYSDSSVIDLANDGSNVSISSSRSGVLKRQKKQRDIKKILQIINDHGESNEEKANFLADVLSNEELVDIMNSSDKVFEAVKKITDPVSEKEREDEVNTALFMVGQQKRILGKVAGRKSSKKGRVDDFSKNFMSNVVMSVIKTPQDGNKVDEKVSVSSKQITNYKICQTLGLTGGGGNRLIKIASRKRLAFYKNATSAVWAAVPKKKSYSKIKPELRERIKDWIMSHPQVKESPIANDTIQLKGEDEKSFQHVNCFWKYLSGNFTMT